MPSASLLGDGSRSWRLLGMQAMGAAFGAAIVRAPTLVHGEASPVDHDGAGLLAGMAPAFMAARYHSLCVDPATLRRAGPHGPQRGHDVLMGIRHATLPMDGVQFHPESVLTPEGPHLLANFLRLAGEGDAGRLDAAGASFATRGLDGSVEEGTADQLSVGGAAMPATVEDAVAIGRATGTIR